VSKLWIYYNRAVKRRGWRVVYNESVLRLIRREIRKREGILVDEEHLAAAIHAILSPEAREKIGPVRIRRRRATRSKAPGVVETAPAAASNAAAGAGNEKTRGTTG
jgi:hypothetical protein